MANEKTATSNAGALADSKKPATVTEPKWVDISEDSDERPVWDFKLNPICDGKCAKIKLVDVEYEGDKRPRTMVIMEVAGERVTAWLPEMHFEDAVKKCPGKRVRITRAGTTKSDTRYTVQVAA